MASEVRRRGHVFSSIPYAHADEGMPPGDHRSSLAAGAPRWRGPRRRTTISRTRLHAEEPLVPCLARTLSRVLGAFCALVLAASRAPAVDVHAVPAPVREFVELYCFECHDNGAREAGLSLEAALDGDLAATSTTWELAVRRLRARQMPPTDAMRPAEGEYAKLLGVLEGELDRAAREHPRPGRTETFRRLTRTEYKNAIRDLLALDVDVDALLPADEASHGFDNVTVSGLSPTLLNRYVTAAQRIAGAGRGRALAGRRHVPAAAGPDPGRAGGGPAAGNARRDSD
jgi:hypothetical protein